MKRTRLNSGYVVMIRPQEEYEGLNPIEFDDNLVEINLWQKRSVSLQQSEWFGDDILSPGDIYDRLAHGLVGNKNASDEDLANAIGWDAVITYDLFARPHLVGSIEQEYIDVMERAVSFVKTVVAYFKICKYEHGSVRYYVGEPTDCFDSGYVGIAVVPYDNIEGEERTYEKARDFVGDLLERYSAWCNGELYEVVVLDPEGDIDDVYSGYLAEDDPDLLQQFDDFVKQYQRVDPIYEPLSSIGDLVRLCENRRGMFADDELMYRALSELLDDHPELYCAGEFDWWGVSYAQFPHSDNPEQTDMVSVNVNVFGDDWCKEGYVALVAYAFVDYPDGTSGTAIDQVIGRAELPLKEAQEVINGVR